MLSNYNDLYPSLLDMNGLFGQKEHALETVNSCLLEVQ